MIKRQRQPFEGESCLTFEKMIDGVVIQLAGNAHHLLKPFREGQSLRRFRPRPGRAAEFFLHFPRADDMIVMLMGEDNPVESDPHFPDPVCDAFRRIKEPMLSRNLHEVAVRLKKPAAVDFNLKFIHVDG